MPGGGEGRTFAIVPVKALADSKSRLAAVLSPAERAALTLDTLRAVLDALDLPGIAARLVVSPDPAVLDAAQASGATGLLQRCTPPDAADGLNGALEEARVAALAAGAGALLIVLGDLPLLGRGNVEALLELADMPRVVVLAPDRRESGTNALLVRPANALPFAFGPGSLARHQALAAARGLRIAHYRAPGAALDLDTPDDLRMVEGYRLNVAGRGVPGL